MNRDIYDGGMGINFSEVNVGRFTLICQYLSSICWYFTHKLHSYTHRFRILFIKSKMNVNMLQGYTNTVLYIVFTVQQL